MILFSTKEVIFFRFLDTPALMSQRIGHRHFNTSSHKNRHLGNVDEFGYTKWR